MRWYGIDFSGDHTKWRPGTSSSNVWIATIDETSAGRKLTLLERVQQLPVRYGDHPFDRLVSLLQQRDFTAAGIDAPFSIPQQYVQRYDSYHDLLSAIQQMDVQGRPFPDGRSFFTEVTGCQPPLQPPKPLRQTEAMRPSGVNIRSTLWAETARPGAPMTAACLR